MVGQIVENALFRVGLFQDPIRQRRRARYEASLDGALATKHRPDTLFFPKPFRETEYPDSLFQEWMWFERNIRGQTDPYYESIARQYGIDIVTSRTGASMGLGALGIINVIIDNDIDTIFWMDKSARPLQRLTRAVWNQLLNTDPERPGHFLPHTDPRYYPFPESRYMDIGQFDEGDGQISRTEIHMDAVGPLRKRFTQIPPHGNVLILDDASRSGLTLDGAEKLVSGMYPHAGRIIKHVGLTGLQFWHNRPDLVGVADGPNENFEDEGIRPYFTRRYESPVGTKIVGDEEVIPRQRFLQLLDHLSTFIAVSVGETPPKGSRKIEKTTLWGC
ncbi:MAG: hypothetical protein ACREGI_00975 [Candidatus Levyibacteriota bacterium]